MRRALKCRLKAYGAAIYFAEIDLTAD
jgi:hypothetical protein